MLFGNDRDQLRRFWCRAWADHRAGRPLEPLQARVVAVIGEHPEYQPLLEDAESACARDWLPEGGETNPFLHMGLHLAVREQIGTDRPAGVRPLYQRLRSRETDPHALEHRMMDCLAETIWRAQREGQTPDEAAYLDCLRALVEADH